MKNKQRYLEPIFAQWLDISTSDNATRACLEGGVWAEKTNYSCPRLSAAPAPAPSLEEDGDLDMSIYVYTVGNVTVISACVSVFLANNGRWQFELANKCRQRRWLFECEIDAIYNSVHKVVATSAPPGGGLRSLSLVAGPGQSAQMCVENC